MPLATAEVGAATRVTTRAVAVSTVKFTAADWPASAPAPLAVTVAEPTTVEVSVTTAWLAALVVLVLADRLPRLVPQLTVTPAPTGLPLASCTVAVSVLAAVPLATAEVGAATRVTTRAELASAVNFVSSAAERTPLLMLTRANSDFVLLIFENASPLVFVLSSFDKTFTPLGNVHETGSSTKGALFTPRIEAVN